MIIGKTEFAYFHPGKTRNPHDTARTPCGSSSGSAAAVATGIVPLAIGSQTNRSVIRPGAFWRRPCNEAGPRLDLPKSYRAAWEAHRVIMRTGMAHNLGDNLDKARSASNSAIW